MSKSGITGDKLFSYLDRVTGDKKPITADIYLTNYCNNKCPYCVYGRWELDAGAYAMTGDDFIKYANRLHDLGVQGFILTGGGEPTLNPDFDKITGYLDWQGWHYGINTNFNRLRFPKPDFLKVSLDGWDEDSYQASRGVRAYHQTVANLREYIDWKKANSPKTSVGIQCVATSAEAVERFVNANANLDVDYISIRPVESTKGEYYKSKSKQDEANAVSAAVDRLRAFDERIVRNYKWEMINGSVSKCGANWAEMALNEKGEVMYCCHKPYEIVGHIMDKDILGKKRKAKTDISMCDVPCRLSAPNAFMEQAKKKRKDVWFI